MPKRTNAFQSLVFKLTRQLQPFGAKVEESRLLIDKTTGERREVDVVVEFRSGPHPFLLCLECRSGRRPATVEWVDTMHAKHRALNTNKLVLVSKSGFSHKALTKAQSYGHDAMSVRDAASVDWRSVVDVVPHLGIRVTILPRIRKILLDIPEPDRDRARTITEFRELHIREPGKEPALLWKHVESLLHKRQFTDMAGRAVPVNKPTMLKGTVTLQPGTQVIDSIVGVFSLRSLYVEAEFQRIEKSLPIERYAFGDNVKVALGRGAVDRFPVAMSVSEEKGRSTEVRVRFQSVVENQRIEFVDGRFVTE